MGAADDYPHQLHRHLETGEYSDETISFVDRACKTGRISEQFALEMLQQIEYDYNTREADRVFGSVPDDPRLFDVDL